MERLTSWCEEIEEAFLSCEKCKKNGMTECWSQENCTQTVVDRLAEIEDILGNEYDLDRLRELVKADREGRCVVLPCKPGDTVRFNGNPRSKLEVVDAICIYANGRITYNFHTTGMMTRYVDEWDEDDADNYCPVNIAMKEREENDCT